MKKLIATLCVIILVLSAAGCESITPNPPEPATEVNPTVAATTEATQSATLIESTNIYDIYKIGFNYNYRIFNKNGDIKLERENETRCPYFTMLTDSLLEVKCQTGTGQSTNWAYYYDYEKDIISETYSYVLSSTNILVAHINLNNNGKPILIIQSIFPTGSYYLEISEFEKPLSTPCTDPIQCVTFCNDSKSIEVVYLSGEDYKKATQTFDLY